MTSSVLSARARFSAANLPVRAAEWAAVAAADPHALPTQAPDWTYACCADGRWRDVSRMYVTAEGRRVVMPMVRRNLPGGFEASMPAHWGFGGILAEGGVRREDVALVMADLRARRVVRQSIRPNPLDGELWSAAAAAAGARTLPRVAHVLNLRPGIDALWKGMRTQGRRAVRSSERRGVEVEVDTTGRFIATFFQLFEHSRERWTKQSREPEWLARMRNNRMDSPAKWERIAAHLGDDCRVFLARVDGEPVAANIVLRSANAYHHTRSAMDKDLANGSYASEALVWATIQEAVGAGAQWFHMGESGTSATLSRYKEKFGCRPFAYPEVRVERLPITPVDRAVRTTAKRLVGFREAE